MGRLGPWPRAWMDLRYAVSAPSEARIPQSLGPRRRTRRSRRLPLLASLEDLDRPVGKKLVEGGEILHFHPIRRERARADPHLIDRPAEPEVRSRRADVASHYGDVLLHRND